MQRTGDSKKIWLSTPTMHGNEMQFVQEAFDKNWVAPLGFNVDAFEAEAEAYLQSDMHALALNAGTAALHLAVKLAGVRPGDIVFCTDMTFAATVNPVTYEGGKPVFIDAERETWNMDPAALEKAFEKYPDTKVVMLAHLYGTPAKMDEILAVCEKHGAVLIEDAAEAFAAEYKGKKMGTFGKYAILSFNGNKIITTSGGGMLLTDTKDAKKKAFFWATQARDSAPWYQHSEIGYNYRMSNVVAGIGRGQLVHLDAHRDRKETIYRRYAKGLADLPIQMNPYLAESKPNFWLSCLTIDPEAMERCTPEKLRLALEALNIESRPIWKPMHMQPVYADCDMITNGDNVGEDIFDRGLCLPSDIKMTEEEQDAVIKAITACF